MEGVTPRPQSLVTSVVGISVLKAELKLMHCILTYCMCCCQDGRGLNEVQLKHHPLSTYLDHRQTSWNTTLVVDFDMTHDRFLKAFHNKGGQGN